MEINASFIKSHWPFMVKNHYLPNTITPAKDAVAGFKPNVLRGRKKKTKNAVYLKITNAKI